MTWLRVEPEDVVLFRDARPFSAGEDHRAEGFYPPLPQTLMGSFRSALLQSALCKANLTFEEYTKGNNPALAAIYKHLGSIENRGNLRLLGPLVCRYNPIQKESEPVFPWPADLVGQYVPTPIANSTPPGKCTPLHTRYWTGSLPVAMTPTQVESKQEGGDWLLLEQMKRYLQGDARLPGTEMEAETDEPIATQWSATVVEERTGILRNGSRRTAEEGRLYSVPMHRARWQPGENAASGLLVSWEGAAFPNSYVPLGGEGRSAWVQESAPTSEFQSLLDGKTRKDIASKIAYLDGQFRLILLTPALLVEGWLPAIFDQNASSKWILKSAAVGKPVPVGGWDYANGIPRPMLRAVPAGSVYLGQLKDFSRPAVDKFMDAFHFTTTLQAQEQSDEIDGTTLAHTGFGLTLVGAWKPPSNKKNKP